MFEQYNIVKKATRIIIFAILAYLAMTFLPETKLDVEDICKLVCAMTLIFIVYDFYYPSVRIELENENKKNNNK
jgi:hypothetical protein